MAKKVKFKETDPADWLLILDRIVSTLGVEISFDETDTHRNYTISVNDEVAYIKVKKDE